MTVENKASPEARGERLRHIRDNVLRYSRKEFAEKYGIPPGTLQNWETARNGGLTEPGAKKFLEILTNEGVSCKLEWLMYGIGENPFAVKSSVYEKPGVYKIPQAIAVARELELFHQHVPNAVDTIISDNAMSPVLAMGDLVAGQRYFANDIEKAINLPCIIHTESGEVLVRILQAGTQESLYNLACHNPDSASSLIRNTKIFSAAPILWIRRKN